MLLVVELDAINLTVTTKILLLHLKLFKVPDSVSSPLVEQCMADSISNGSENEEVADYFSVR